MDARVINDKLASLKRCVDRLETWQPASLDDLRSNIDQQDILTLNLSRAVQLCVDIATHISTESAAGRPATMSEAFDRIADLGVIDEDISSNMRSAVGFRNIAVHTYRRISWEIVYRVALDGPGQFRDFARQIRGFLNRKADAEG